MFNSRIHVQFAKRLAGLFKTVGEALKRIIQGGLKLWTRAQRRNLLNTLGRALFYFVVGSWMGQHVNHLLVDKQKIRYDR